MSKLNILARGGTLAMTSLVILGVMASYSLWRWNEVASALLIVAFKDVAMETIRNFNKNVDEVIDDKEPKL